MKTLEIQQQDAIKAYENAESQQVKDALIDLLGEEAFTINAKERFKTIKDVLQYHGQTEKQFNQNCNSLSKDEKAYRLLKMIASALNEGWIPDWSNYSEFKYFPWFDMDTSSASGFAYYGCDDWCSNSNVGSRLCFKSRDLAKYAGQQFEEIYRDFMTI